MNKSKIFLIFIIFFGLMSIQLEAQTLDRKLLTWERKTINIGAVMEEKGAVEAEFYGLNLNREDIILTDVVTDCGCTTVDYTKDTLATDKIGSIKVRFDPDHRGGEFSKVIIVRTNEDIYGDTLYLEGINMPLPENKEMAYPHRIGNLGFRLSAVNMGNVFTNEPKVKHVEIHNFGSEAMELTSDQESLPDYLLVNMDPSPLQADQRGLLVISYDGEKKGDLGYFDEHITLSFLDEEKITIRMMSVVYEYFKPVPKSMEKIVPRLSLSESDIDFREIPSSRKVTKSVMISNLGQENLQIRKLASNCSCIDLSIAQTEIGPGERASLDIEFDPKGRRGIDHKHITIFSNDPINPVRTIVIKSNIK
ncbi:DUF1573 domain-containing protein [Shivajiella indica]|uniref:DUF1573 domain-containing protein n=2 Tax=Shivajiella indica TaxID=872115 RepID=A0ABW5B4V9_9BACT